MTNKEDVEKKKGSVIFSLVPYVSINCIRFTGIISAQSTPTNNEIQSIYFVGKGQGDCNIDTQPPEGGCLGKSVATINQYLFQHTATRRWLPILGALGFCLDGFNTQPPEGGCYLLQ